MARMRGQVQVVIDPAAIAALRRALETASAQVATFFALNEPPQPFCAVGLYEAAMAHEASEEKPVRVHKHQCVWWTAAACRTEGCRCMCGARMRVGQWMPPVVSGVDC